MRLSQTVAKIFLFIRGFTDTNVLGKRVAMLLAEIQRSYSFRLESIVANSTMAKCYKFAHNAVYPWAASITYEIGQVWRSPCAITFRLRHSTHINHHDEWKTITKRGMNTTETAFVTEYLFAFVTIWIFASHLCFLLVYNCAFRALFVHLMKETQWYVDNFVIINTQKSI